MKKGFIITLTMVSSLVTMAQTKPVAKTGAPTTKPKLAATTKGVQLFKSTKDSASYALGYRIAQSLKGQGLQDVNFELFKKGMAAGKYPVNAATAILKLIESVESSVVFKTL